MIENVGRYNREVVSSSLELLAADPPGLARRTHTGHTIKTDPTLIPQAQLAGEGTRQQRGTTSTGVRGGEGRLVGVVWASPLRCRHVCQ